LGYLVQSVVDSPDTGGAKAWARSGVDLVTVVEGVDPASRGLVEVDGAAGIQAADLVTGFSLTDHVCVRRQCDSTNDGATLRVLLGWAKVSGKTWGTTGANAQMVGAQDEGGFGLEESKELRGLTAAEGDTAWTAAALAGPARVMGSRQYLLDGARAVIRQSVKRSYVETTGADATVIKIRSVGDSGKGLVRVWPRRSDTAKTTLTTGSGAAVSGTTYTFPGDTGATTLVHVECVVDDHGDGTFSVMQILAQNAEVLEVWASAYTYYYSVRKMFTRTSDDQVKLVTYTKYVAMRSTEKKAWDAIQGWAPSPANANHKIVEGSDGVVQKGKYQFLATWLTLDATITTGGVRDWEALPAAAP
jgi:hypothetical protein